jgi:hypothetical protein
VKLLAGSDCILIKQKGMVSAIPYKIIGAVSKGNFLAKKL